MSETTPGTGGNEVKTLGIKLDHGLHAQFTLIAQLDGISLTDASVRAVKFYVEHKTAAPDFKTRAAAALQEIERQAAAQRGAIQALFGSDTAQASADAQAEDSKSTEKSSTRRKGEAGA